jgi:hypothetical protein
MKRVPDSRSRDRRHTAVLLAYNQRPLVGRERHVDLPPRALSNRSNLLQGGMQCRLQICASRNGTPCPRINAVGEGQEKLARCTKVLHVGQRRSQESVEGRSGVPKKL